jgi:hypothetical protein
MDTFEYKPALWKYAGQQMPQAARTVGRLRPFRQLPVASLASSRQFKQRGQSGRWMSDLLPNLATRVDDMAFVRRHQS